MPKNKGKGGKNRRRGKNENDNEKRELTFKEDGQEYAQVVKMLGYVLPSPSSSPSFLYTCLQYHKMRRLATSIPPPKKKSWSRQMAQ